MLHATLRKSTDGTPEAVQQMHARQAGRLVRLMREHPDLINDDGMRLFARCAFVLWLDAREPVETETL